MLCGLYMLCFLFIYFIWIPYIVSGLWALHAIRHNEPCIITSIFSFLFWLIWAHLHWCFHIPQRHKSFMPGYLYHPMAFVVSSNIRINHYTCTNIDTLQEYYPPKISDIRPSPIIHQSLSLSSEIKEGCREPIIRDKRRNWMRKV